jgi:hypothetical protein
MLALLLVVCTSFAARDTSPDELGVYGPKDGITRVEARWGTKKFEIALTGSYADPKNEEILKKWIVQCKREVFQ